MFGRWVEPVWAQKLKAPYDARHLRTFLYEHSRQARRGYVVCRCPEPLALDDRITALPWSQV